jgi:hypothetical protein
MWLTVLVNLTLWISLGDEKENRVKKKGVGEKGGRQENGIQ